MTTPSQVVSLLDSLRDRLNDVVTTTNDRELTDLLVSAVAEYEEWVGPLPDPLPANHREMILADIVALYSLSQRGFVEDLDEEGARLPVPVRLYPRIRAYAKTRSAGPRYSFPAEMQISSAWL